MHGMLDTWGGRGVSKQRKGPTFPNHMQISPEHADAQGNIGDIWGCLNIWGVSGTSEHPNIWGHLNVCGVSRCSPSVKHTCN